jgi:hypothetical protein
MTKSIELRTLETLERIESTLSKILRRIDIEIQVKIDAEEAAAQAAPREPKRTRK